MTVTAMQVAVCAQQFEVGLFAVIENPHRPAVGVMAILALSAQRRLVFIVVSMATDALQFGILESGRQMAFFAGHRGVQAKQGEAGQVVIENNTVAPAGHLMAALTLLAFLSLVNIIRLVAAETGGRQVFSVNVAAMTGVAQQLLMLALQWKPGVVLVIEATFFPLFLVVAGLAFFAVATMVRIVVAMAVDTDRSRFPVLDRILVTGLTAHIGVPALQAKFCVFIMIEL